MENLDKETLTKLIESGVIVVIALALFFGLRGRILRFAQWAPLPRLAFAPVRLTLRYAILAVATVLVLGRWGFHVDALIAVVGTILGLVAPSWCKQHVFPTHLQTPDRHDDRRSGLPTAEGPSHASSAARPFTCP